MIEKRRPNVGVKAFWIFCIPLGEVSKLVGKFAPAKFGSFDRKPNPKLKGSKRFPSPRPLPRGLLLAGTFAKLMGAGLLTMGGFTTLMGAGLLIIGWFTKLLGTGLFTTGLLLTGALLRKLSQSLLLPLENKPIEIKPSRQSQSLPLEDEPMEIKPPRQLLENKIFSAAILSFPFDVLRLILT